MISGSLNLSRHCERSEAISEKSQDFSGSLSTMQNQEQSHLGNLQSFLHCRCNNPRHPNNPADYSEIASTATHSRNDEKGNCFAVLTTLFAITKLALLQ